MERLSKQLLDVLACPKCRSELLYKNDKLTCKNQKCKTQYRIENGIPILLGE